MDVGVDLRIHLLGTPTVQRGGIQVEAPAGRKHWGLLTYLVRTEVPSSRERLSAMLFPEADDPLGALRSTLSALRRQLGPHAEVGGNPVRLALGPAAFVDVEILRTGSWVEAAALPGLGHELLDGMAFRSSPSFENWLENERRHVAGTTAAVLHEAALALLARGEADTARSHAAHLVRLNAYDENAHVLLVRCLRAVGDAEAAERQVTACTELFRRELGIEPSPALASAAAEPLASVGTRVSGPSAVNVLIETGMAAVEAGAPEAGVARLRGAVASARREDDPVLLARALVGLGQALVHSCRGTDEEGAEALHEGSVLAERIGERLLAATGWREAGWIQFLRGRYDRAEATLARAGQLANGDEEELAWIEVILGTCRSDVGDYASAARLLLSATARSEGLQTPEALVYTLTMHAKLHVLRNELDEATALLDRALELVDARGLNSFRSWPESFRAEIHLRHGHVNEAADAFEHAFALGCEIGDPCWESIATRGRGLVAIERGEVERGLELLVEAPRLCRRLPDTYLWIEAYGLDALCGAAVEHGEASAKRWVGELEAIAASRGLRDLLVRATIHRARLGDPGALESARSLAAQVDNPALDELLASVA
ncbi:MAG TPA: BTAD domain-containing putative transcriptional regulator [Gaiellaceae bacterium]|nr:BTAD domain-containing putative transcriptional regulator [Gaiellaceae bacterium]